MLVAVVAAFSVCGVASAQSPKSPAKKPAEPKCCKGMKCEHKGEKSHHKCMAACHDKHQNKGECCKKHDHKQA
jgi:hypothetical protein